MNKNLIAMAVAAALAAPMAAQAEATIYGKMHVSIDSITNDNSTVATDSSTGVSSNSSRIGFKGAEDLGNGMKAIWQIESSLGVTDGTGTWDKRNTFAGLAGGFGTALIGRHDTPYKTVGRKADLFGDSVGDSRTMTNQAGMDLRTSNTLAYVTPDMSGFNAVLAYVTDYNGDKGDDNDNSATSISLNYTAGPLYVGVATQSVTGTGAGIEDISATRLGVAYDMGMAKVTALYDMNTNVNGVDGMDNSTMGIGAAFKAGEKGAVKVQYYSMGEYDNMSDTEATKMAVGYDHKMSKNTTVYAAYAAVSNGDASAINVTEASGFGDQGPAGAPEAGGSPTAISFGLIHKF